MTKLVDIKAVQFVKCLKEDVASQNSKEPKDVIKASTKNARICILRQLNEFLIYLSQKKQLQLILFHQTLQKIKGFICSNCYFPPLFLFKDKVFISSVSCYSSTYILSRSQKRRTINSSPFSISIRILTLISPFGKAKIKNTIQREHDLVLIDLKVYFLLLYFQKQIFQHGYKTIKCYAYNSSAT